VASHPRCAEGWVEDQPRCGVREHTRRIPRPEIHVQRSVRCARLFVSAGPTSLGTRADDRGSNAGRRLLTAGEKPGGSVRRIYDVEGDLCDSDRAEIVRHSDGGQVHPPRRECRSSPRSDG
jgi:hypothetical protein